MISGKTRPLAGDELLADARAQLTHAIDIHARPEAIWPWLAQMGRGRAGFYSIDVLDNRGVRSAREVHPELQAISVGQIIPAGERPEASFEVLRVEPPLVLVLGGLWDPADKQRLPFIATRPRRYSHVTWAFVLEPLDEHTTRLHARVRVACPWTGALQVALMRPVHHVMQTAQLRNLAARVEGRQRRDDWRDVLAGIRGALAMALYMTNPLVRLAKRTSGLGREDARRAYPGDELVPSPRWHWIHAVEIDASPSEVWPWIAQIGVGRGGFYSYQWLENVVGCGVRNAETVHPDWQLEKGSGIVLHPDVPPLEVVSLDPGRSFVAWAAPDDAARAEGRPWIAASWAFIVEPIEGDAKRTRLISRYRADYSGDPATRMKFGPTLLEPIGAVMDFRMLRGVKERAEHVGARNGGPPSEPAV